MEEEAVQAEAVEEATAEGTTMATSPARDPILDPLPIRNLSSLPITLRLGKVPQQHTQQ